MSMDGSVVTVGKACEVAFPHLQLPVSESNPVGLWCETRISICYDFCTAWRLDRGRAWVTTAAGNEKLLEESWISFLPIVDPLVKHAAASPASDETSTRSTGSV